MAFALALKIKNLLEARGQKIESLYPLMSLVAIGTLCDMAPLNPMNLKLTRHGLRSFANTSIKGLTHYLPKDQASMESVPGEYVTFQVGPLINSKGRLDHPEMALQSLITNGHMNGIHLHAVLEQCNGERKVIQRDVVLQAREQIKEEIKQSKNGSIRDLPVVMAKGHDWHEGVIGIAASKLVEIFKRPAMVFTQSDNPKLLKASIRSTGSLNIYSFLSDYRNYFVKFGGHSAAAGLSMEKEKYPEFKKKIYAELHKVPEEERTLVVKPHLEIRLDQLTLPLVEQIEKVGPFGPGYPMPIFKVTNLELTDFQLMKSIHVRWLLRDRDMKGNQVTALSFFYRDYYDVIDPAQLLEMSKSGRSISAIGTFSFNFFRGKRYLQMLLKSIHPD